MPAPAAPPSAAAGAVGALEAAGGLAGGGWAGAPTRPAACWWPRRGGKGCASRPAHRYATHRPLGLSAGCVARQHVQHTYIERGQADQVQECRQCCSFCMAGQVLAAGVWGQHEWRQVGGAGEHMRQHALCPARGVGTVAAAAVLRVAAGWPGPCRQVVEEPHHQCHACRRGWTTAGLVLQQQPAAGVQNVVLQKHQGRLQAGCWGARVELRRCACTKHFAWRAGPPTSGVLASHSSSSAITPTAALVSPLPSHCCSTPSTMLASELCTVSWPDRCWSTRARVSWLTWDASCSHVQRAWAVVLQCSAAEPKHVSKCSFTA